MQQQPIQPIPPAIPTMVPLLCPKCGGLITSEEKFCPTCGILLQDKEITIGRQIFVYSVSFFLPPLGLVWVSKYLKSANQANKRAGIIIIILTVVSLILTLWVGVGFISTLQQQLGAYQNVGL